MKVAFVSLIGMFAVSAYADLVEDIANDLKLTQMGLGKRECDLTILNPYLPATDSVNPRSGNFLWKCDGVENVIVSHLSSKINPDGRRYEVAMGQMRAGDTCVRFNYIVIPDSSERPLVGSRSSKDIDYANPALCFQYEGMNFAEFASEGEAVLVDTDEALVRGNSGGHQFQIRVTRKGKRWLLRDVEATYARSSLLKLTDVEWLIDGQGMWLPKSGKFWAGGATKEGSRRDETFEAFNWRSSGEAVNFGSVLQPNNVLSSAEGAYIYRGDGTFELVETQRSGGSSPWGALYVVSSAGLLFCLCGLLSKRLKVRPKAAKVQK